MALKTALATCAAVVAMSSAGAAFAYGSDYTLATDLNPEGTYANLTNPYLYRTDGAWGSYVGPTGSGTFEVINGGGDPTQRFYYNTVHLTGGVPYVIAADIANNYPTNAPIIQLVVNGVDAGPSQTLSSTVTGNSAAYTPGLSPTPVGPFIIHDFAYTPSASGNYTIGFVDLDTEPNGNDFSFDPATSGLAAPEPASWALMILGMAGLGAGLRGRRRAALAA